MVFFSKLRVSALTGLGFAACGLAAPANAQTAGNAGLQDYFRNTVCNNPTGLFAARCMETFDPGVPDGDPNQFANISSDSESSLNPSQVSAAASNALARAEALAAETQERLEAVRDEENGEPGSGSGTIAGFGPWSVFANVQGEWFEQDRLAYANERGFDGDRIRGTIGADYRVNAGTRIGLMVTYEDYSLDFDKELPGVNFTPADSAGGADSETISLAAYATFSLADSAWFDASAGIGWSDNDFQRNAVFQPSTRTLQRDINAFGSADGDQYFVAFGLGYDYAAGPLSVGPYIRGRYVRSSVDAYVEEDANATGLQLAVSKQKAKSLTGLLGVNASYAISTSWGVILPQARFEYEHEFEDDARTTLTGFALDPNNTTFAVVGDSPDRDYFNAGLGLLFVLPNGIMPFIDYEVLVGYRNFDRHRLTAGLRVEL